MKMRAVRHCAGLVAAISLLVGCGGNAAAVVAPTASPADTGARYQAPPFADSVFSAEAATGDGGVLVDISHAAQGYVAVSANNEKRLKFQVVFGEVKYNYDLPGDGTPTIFPLQSGSGAYTLKVMQNVTESKYTPIYTAEVTAELENDRAPFLRPSQYVNYTQSSDCVVKAAELVQDAEDDAGVVANIYAYIQENIDYDTEKADAIQTLGQYLPSPDETLSSKKGICFDYAALAAAMLRSQGIPTKLITGYVAPNDIYHAWNMVWLEKTGWITVKIQAPARSWERIDLTFASGGVDAKYVGDGTNYTDSLVY